MVSDKSPNVVGTAELKEADWYMTDSLEDAHWMLPPRDSKDSSISFDDLTLVD